MEVHKTLLVKAQKDWEKITFLILHIMKYKIQVKTHLPYIILSSDPLRKEIYLN